MNASMDTDFDETMEDVDENEEDGDVDEAPEANTDLGMNQDRGVPHIKDGPLADSQDHLTDPSTPSPSQSRPSRPPLATFHSHTQHTTMAPRRNSAATDEPSRSGFSPHIKLEAPRTPTSPQRQFSIPEIYGGVRPTVRPEAVTARVYDIVPTIAAPHSTSINAIAATPDLRWVFSGGTDGYIRKFGWVDTANGKSMLTVAQRHPFVDSVIKAGVLLSYWENEEPQLKSPTVPLLDENLSLSPVYSLAVQSQGLWLLSGLDSGGINLQSVRHDEGKRIACLRKHTSAVSVLTLPTDEKSLLSGSWDKNVYDWDLNTGQVRREFNASGGQISAIELRPASNVPVLAVAEETPTNNGTLATNSMPQSLTNGVLADATDQRRGSASNQDVNGEGNQASPAHSLFSVNDDDSLFGGDYDEKSAPGALAENQFGEDDDDEFSRAIAHGLQQQEQSAPGGSQNGNPPVQDSSELPENGQPDTQQAGQVNSEASAENVNGGQDTLTNGLPHTDETPEAPMRPQASETNDTRNGMASSSDTIFLAASHDGTLRVWDRRQSNPLASILPRNVPPWCMGACWSPDGNFIYAGRRNGTVEEYSVHKGLRDPERTFRFPQGSGPVSAVKAMPNGRHLICASHDILRLHDLTEQQTFKHSTVPFLIIPGHRGGVISSLYIDPTCRYLISTSGNRGWEGSTTEVMLGYEVGIGQ
ncbi:MAG: Transcription factor spt8 [Peltula sp. TS41687]|nr:MAG: Transcription factor spt8 [Peltula sp. TS41687]